MSSSPTTTTGQISDYSAAANGQLTPISGSPFPDFVNYTAVNGAWLFGVANLDSAINSYSIGSNGALTQKESHTVTGGQAISMWLDHTGSTLYVDSNDGDSNNYLELSVDQSTGALTEIGTLSLGPGDETVDDWTCTSLSLPHLSFAGYLEHLVRTHRVI